MKRFLVNKEIYKFSNKFENTGLISMRWDSKDQNGHRVASGIYFVSLVVVYKNIIFFITK